MQYCVLCKTRTVCGLTFVGVALEFQPIEGKALDFLIAKHRWKVQDMTQCPQKTQCVATRLIYGRVFRMSSIAGCKKNGKLHDRNRCLFAGNALCRGCLFVFDISGATINAFSQLSNSGEDGNGLHFPLGVEYPFKPN